MLSNDEVYQNFYSVTGLFERLREDAGRYPDTMDQRYGAWAQLLTLFRLIYDGGRHAGMRIPPRKDTSSTRTAICFLEGRPKHSKRQQGELTRRRRASPTAWSTASSRTCSSSTANGSATAPSTSSRSDRL